MEQTSITLVINDQTYRLKVGDIDAIAAMPYADRQQLTALLNSVQHYEQQADAKAQEAINKVRSTATGASAEAQPVVHIPKPERLGSGDADALMARLIMEEQMHKKPPLTKQTLYKWIGGIAITIILLILIL